jgi:hypothetical protein
MVKTLWTKNIDLNNEGQVYKIGPVRGRILQGKGGLMETVIWSLYFILMYEDKTLYTWMRIKLYIHV